MNAQLLEVAVRLSNFDDREGGAEGASAMAAGHAVHDHLTVASQAVRSQLQQPAQALAAVGPGDVSELVLDPRLLVMT